MARRHADNHSGRQMVNPVTGASYTVASPDGVYTFTASFGSVSASRTLIQADHGHTPFQSVGLAFDGETLQLGSTQVSSKSLGRSLN